MILTKLSVLGFIQCFILIKLNKKKIGIFNLVSKLIESIIYVHLFALWSSSSSRLWVLFAIPVPHHLSARAVFLHTQLVLIPVPCLKGNKQAQDHGNLWNNKVLCKVEELRQVSWEAGDSLEILSSSLIRPYYTETLNPKP